MQGRDLEGKFRPRLSFGYDSAIPPTVRHAETGSQDWSRNAIFDDLGRGLTFLAGRGGYDHRRRDVIYVCGRRRQVNLLRKMVADIDPGAFMVMHDAYDVMGYGFRERTITY